MEKSEKFLLSYLEVIAGLKRSGILMSVSHRNEETEDAYDLLFLPVCRLESIYTRMLKDDIVALDSTLLEEIASDSNAVWYALDCRSDIPMMIPKRKFALTPQTSITLSAKLGRSIPLQMNISDVHQLASEVEMLIREGLL